MFLPGPVKACLFGVSMSSFRHLILGLLIVTMSPWSVFADPNGGTLDSRMENDQYPIHPHEEMTPGALCNNPDSYRYPEHISYCNRSVETQLKREIIVKYDQSFGYRIASSNRADFKIDHLIPLCMGGANHIDNLWPQHKAVYAITDPLEPTFCNKMKEDKLHQKEAVELIIYAKHHLDEVADILKRVEAL